MMPQMMPQGGPQIQQHHVQTWQDLLAQAQQNLTPAEIQELKSYVTPRVIQLWGKAFPQMAPMLQMFQQGMSQQSQSQAPNYAQSLYQGLKGGQ